MFDTLVRGLKLLSLCVNVVEKVLQFFPASLGILQLSLEVRKHLELHTGNID